LRATVEWSHALLDETEQACFARFAVLPGGATIDAAEAVTGAGLGTLDGLVTKSLLVRRQHAHAPTRLGMLETVRSYAAERLEAAADRDEIHARQYRFFLALAQRHGTDRALCGAARQDHAARLDAEIDNVHEALEWSLHQPDAGPALAMCVALSQYWSMRNRYAEALDWTDRALTMPGADACPALRVRALCSKAVALWPLWRQTDNAAVLAEAETVARASGDPLILSQALQLRARIEASDGIEDGPEATANEALQLATAADDAWAIAMAAYATVVVAATLVTLRERVDRAATLLDDVGNSYHLARVLAIAAYSALCLGSERDAKAYVDRAAPMTRVIDDPQAWMFLLGNAGMIALRGGDTDAADHLFREHLGYCRAVVSPRFAYDGLLGLSIVAASRDETHRSARLAGAAAAHRDEGPADSVETQLDADHLQPARARHGTSAWDAAAREGATLGLEEAIDFALRDPPP
jgi:hypothetical protein